jgi:nucleoid-associated protein YgaU
MRLPAAIGLIAIAAGLAAAPLPGGFPPGGGLHLARWWESAGPVVGLYGVTRLFLVVVVASWASLLLLRWAVASTRVGAALAARLTARMAAGGRRAGWGGLLRVVLGLSASGAAAAGCGTSGHRVPGAFASQGVTVSAGSASAAPRPGAASSADHTAITDPATTLPAPVLVGPRATVAPVGVPETAPTPDPAAPILSAPARMPPPAPHPGVAAASTTVTSTGSGVATGDTAAVGSWTVRAGDDLWTIAATVVASHGRPSTDVASYWARLVEANRRHLPVPSDPSLIFPGDVLILPALSG